jgi:hypothetical protein
MRREKAGYAAVSASVVETEMLSHRWSQTAKGAEHGSLTLKKEPLCWEEAGRTGSTGIPQKAKLQGTALLALKHLKREQKRMTKAGGDTTLGRENTAHIPLELVAVSVVAMA